MCGLDGLPVFIGHKARPEARPGCDPSARRDKRDATDDFHKTADVAFFTYPGIHDARLLANNNCAPLRRPPRARAVLVHAADRDVPHH